MFRRHLEGFAVALLVVALYFVAVLVLITPAAAQVVAAPAPRGL